MLGLAIHSSIQSSRNLGGSGLYERKLLGTTLVCPWPLQACRRDVSSMVFTLAKGTADAQGFLCFPEEYLVHGILIQPSAWHAQICCGEHPVGEEAHLSQLEPHLAHKCQRVHQFCFSFPALLNKALADHDWVLLHACQHLCKSSYPSSNARTTKINTTFTPSVLSRGIDEGRRRQKGAVA